MIITMSDSFIIKMTYNFLDTTISPEMSTVVF